MVKDMITMECTLVGPFWKFCRILYEIHLKRGNCFSIFWYSVVQTLELLFQEIFDPFTKLRLSEWYSFEKVEKEHFSVPTFDLKEIEFLFRNMH